jgi:glycerol-3-phosphate dehydrogenase
VAALLSQVTAKYPFLTPAQALRMVRAYGTQTDAVLGGAKDKAALGEEFGAGLTAVEVAWLMEHRWARTADDVLWRRTKLGLRLNADQAARLAAWMAERRSDLAERSQAAE